MASGNKKCMTWWGSLISRAVWQWSQNIFQVLTLSANLPSILPFGWKQEEEMGTSVLSLIGFDFGGTQLPTDRTFPVQVSVPPAGAAKNDGGTRKWGCRQTSQRELPSENMRAQIANWFCNMSVMGCQNSNSVGLLATKAYWKGLSTVTWHIFSVPPAVMYFSLFILMFWLVQTVK